MGGQGRPVRRPLSTAVPRAAEPTRPDRRARGHTSVTGRAAPLLLFVLALAAGGAALVLALNRGGAAAPGAVPARPPGALPAPEPPTAAPEGARTPAGAPSDARVAPPAAAGDLALRADGATDPAEARFEGERGRIRGFIETADATPFPQRWTLALEPSRTLAGRHRAERRVLEFAEGEQEFVVPDLPLAGYDLCASAPGMNAHPSPVLLDRLNRDPYVTLQFYPAGFVAGRVLDHEHLPADDLLVTLTDAARTSPRETRTDVLGNFRFDGVLDGEYTLSFGPTLTPLLPGATLRFSAPSLTLPDRQLPPLAALSILVLDDEGRAVPEATVRGAGPPGGAVEVKTDARGAAVARYLPPGLYRLSAEHELHGRARQATELSLPAGDVVLRFRPPR